MQFLKVIKTKSIPVTKCDKWFVSGCENKIDIKKYIEKILFVPHLHKSKSGIINLLNNFSCELYKLELTKIEQLYKEKKISLRLKNLFSEIHSPKYTFTQNDKKEINKLCADKIITHELRNIYFGIYQPKDVIADMAACQIKMLFEKEFLNNRIIKECLKCCRDLVFNLGYKDLVIYKEITVEEDALKTIVNTKGVKNIMIIPGCQHEGMLTGRVLKAVRVLNNFHQTNLKIIASGGNPLDNPTGPSKVSIVSESAFILKTIDDLINSMNISRPEGLTVIEEKDAFDTKSNIRNSLLNLNEQETHNIIIVSSTFQLIKIARDVENILTERFKDKEKKKVAKFVKNIILIGAEGVDANFTPSKSSGYIKSMFFEVYNELMQVSNNN